MHFSNMVAVGNNRDTRRCRNNNIRAGIRDNRHGREDTDNLIKAKHSGVLWKMMKRMRTQSGLTSTLRKKLVTFSDVKFLMRKIPGRLSRINKPDSSRIKIQNETILKTSSMLCSSKNNRKIWLSRRSLSKNSRQPTRDRLKKKKPI